VEWRGVIARFDRDGLLKSTTFQPGMAHTYQVWQTNDFGNEILRRLIDKPPPEPVSVFEIQQRLAEKPNRRWLGLRR
jgi:hypothetical protein